MSVNGVADRNGLARGARRCLLPVSLLLATAVGLFVSPSLQAEDLQLNSYTTNNQLRPAVAMRADGRFVVVWEGYGSSGNDTSDRSVQRRLFTSSGAASGGELQVNTYTANQQRDAAVAMRSDGGFVVVWESIGSSDTDTSLSSIQGRLFASSGAVIGGDFQINTYTSNLQNAPAVVMESDGDFVVVWASDGSSDTDTSGGSIQAQFFTSTGAAISGQFQVNTDTTNTQLRPAVAMASGGDFVVVWESFASSGTDTSSTSIHAQLFTSSGAAIGSQFQVNTYTTGYQLFPDVAMAGDGDFVVVWESKGSSSTDTSGYSIHGKRFTSDGAAIGGQFQINTYTTNDQRHPTVAMAGDGDFVVVWRSNGSFGDDPDLSIQRRHFASSGAAIGGQFQVNTYTTSLQSNPAVATKSDGDFVVVWGSHGSFGNDTSGSSIQAFLSPIFADGFESGNTIAWSATVP